MTVVDLPDVVFPKMTASESILRHAEAGYLLLVQHVDGEVMILGSAHESEPDRLLELGVDRAGLEWLPNEANIDRKALAFFDERQGKLTLQHGSAGHLTCCGYNRLTPEEQEKAQQELDRLTAHYLSSR
jgi:hypothetical protein